MFWVGLNRPRRLPDPKLLPPVPKRPLRGKQVPRPSQGRGAGATTGPAGQGQPSARDAAAPALRFHFPLPAPIWAKGASLSRSMKFKAREPCCFHFGNCFRTDECSCWEPGRDSDVGTDTSQTLVPATSWSSCRPGWGGGASLGVFTGRWGCGVSGAPAGSVGAGPWDTVCVPCPVQQRRRALGLGRVSAESHLSDERSFFFVTGELRDSSYSV